MSNITYIKQWIRRERRYTSQFAVQVYAALNSQMLKAASEYRKVSTFTVDSDMMLKIYRKHYKSVVDQEATITLNSISGKKDMLSDIVKFFGLTSDTSNLKLIRDLMNDYFDSEVMLRLMQVNENTKTSIQKIIKFGIDRGLSINDIAKLIVAEGKEINKARAVRIARTETVTAANRTQLLVHEASPFLYEKAWLPVVDGRTRDGHVKMNPKVFIDLWDLFKVNHSKNRAFDMMLIPGDPSASPANTVNCRCTLLFKVKRDIDGRPIRK